MEVVSLSITEVLAIVGPMYAAMLTVVRDTYSGSEEVDIENLQDEVEELEVELGMLRELAATREDVHGVQRIIDHLHDEADIIHHDLIDSNPCSMGPECEWCVMHDESE